MKKVTPKQAAIVVKSGISNLMRDLADKKFLTKLTPSRTISITASRSLTYTLTKSTSQKTPTVN